MSETPEKRPKASWPLLTLAILGFIPAFGFLFASVALTWALNSSRPRARLAGWLAVFGAVANLVMAIVLASIGSTPESRQTTDRRMAQLELSKIAAALEADRGADGTYPASLELLVGYPIPHRILNIRDIHHGFRMQAPDYVYRRSADGRSYDLFGRGADDLPDTDDDIRPVLSDSLRSHSGYRPMPGDTGR